MWHRNPVKLRQVFPFSFGNKHMVNSNSDHTSFSLRKIPDLGLLCLCFSLLPQPTKTNEIIVRLDSYYFKHIFISFASILPFFPCPPANPAHVAFSLVFMGFHRLLSIWVKVLWRLSSPQTFYCGPDDVR